MQLDTEQRAAIEQRIAEITEARQRYIIESSRQMGGFDGALTALRALLTEAEAVAAATE